jgi:hypothetical protein
MQETGKWNVLEVDNQFVTLSVKCYLCKHWTILRIPIEDLKKELGKPEKAMEEEASTLARIRKKAEPDEDEPETVMK